MRLMDAQGKAAATRTAAGSTAAAPTTRRVYGLIAAAGKGTRLGAEVPKAYVALRGRTLLERSVQAMITSDIVDEIIVVVAASMHDYAQELLDQAGLLEEIPVRFVIGRGERADSVWEGLQTISDAHAVVLVHDAARALTPPGMIARVARKVLDGAPAVLPVLPVADTVKQVAGDQVVATPPRAQLRLAQTPQGFDVSLLKAANAAYFGGDTAVQDPDFQATDDASLIEWFGQPVTCVAGDPMAFKVTSPLDYAVAQAVTDAAEPTIFEVPDA